LDEENMTIVTSQSILNRYSNTIVNHARQMADAQAQFLELRKSGLLQIVGDLSQQLEFPSIATLKRPPILFDQDWLKEFSVGDITRCLGQEFRIYEGRRSPRIPNGDLLLISRILKIDGIRNAFDIPSEITAEYDVPSAPWYLKNPNSSELPISILMEIALQPCGVLSAWLHTQLRLPDVDFFFRNLDGQITLLKPVDLRGKTITIKAILEKTVFSGTTIIQQFQFVLSCDRSDFLKGQTTFGYFPEETMAAQVGLDGGRPVLPWGRKPENQGKMRFVKDKSGFRVEGLSRNKLQMIDEIGYSQEFEEKTLGYVFAERKNDPSDWYYTNHFMGDPVMPGSLGIEAIIQSFASGIPYLTGSNKEIRFACGQEMKWKYRGQVLPANGKVQIDIRVAASNNMDGEKSYIGSANLWVDDLRIYEIENLAFVQ
jgi:3-hydroxymyristoyl/3-hydroxydecanoyl-(acyl carrier protein) dehydratase